MPTPEELARLARAEVGSLDRDEGEASASDADIEAKRAHGAQVHAQRGDLFAVIKRSLIGALSASVLVTVLYMLSEWGEIDSAVLIAFNVSVVVHTIGLAYIVANYLFPKGGGD